MLVYAPAVRYHRIRRGSLRVSENRHRASEQDNGNPPEDADPGQWALDQYRAWRQRIYGSPQTSETKQLGKLLDLRGEESSA